MIYVLFTKGRRQSDTCRCHQLLEDDSHGHLPRPIHENVGPDVSHLGHGPHGRRYLHPRGTYRDARYVQTVNTKTFENQHYQPFLKMIGL